MLVGEFGKRICRIHSDEADGFDVKAFTAQRTSSALRIIVVDADEAVSAERMTTRNEIGEADDAILVAADVANGRRVDGEHGLSAPENGKELKGRAEGGSKL